jgi:hypothetical protein
MIASQLSMACEFGMTDDPSPNMQHGPCEENEDALGFSHLSEIATNICDSSNMSLTNRFDCSPVRLPDDTSFLLQAPSHASSLAALHALETHLCVPAFGHSEFYHNICAISLDLLGPTAPLQAHTDCGSMATTTHQ